MRTSTVCSYPLLAIYGLQPEPKGWSSGKTATRVRLPTEIARLTQELEGSLKIRTGRSGFSPPGGSFAFGMGTAKQSEMSLLFHVDTPVRS